MNDSHYLNAIRVDRSLGSNSYVCLFLCSDTVNILLHCTGDSSEQTITSLWWFDVLCNNRFWLRDTYQYINILWYLLMFRILFIKNNLNFGVVMVYFWMKSMLTGHARIYCFNLPFLSQSYPWCSLSSVSYINQ